MLKFYLSVFAGFLFSIQVTAQTITDIDGNVYTTMTYGSQVWMTENLKVTRFQNGTLVPNVLSNSTWTNLIQSPGRCYPLNDSTNTADYGALYNFHTVSNTANICPAGWHVPTDSEWNTLAYFLDPTVDTNFVGATGTGTTIGNAIKDTGTTYWDISNTGTNTSGFNARGAGYRQSSGSFNGFRTFAYFWTSSFAAQGKSWLRNVGFIDPGINRFTADRLYGANVRCVQNTITTGEMESPINEGISLYPNPFDDEIRYDCSSCGQANLSVFSMTGQIILTEDLRNNSGVFSTSDWTEGAYLVRVVSTSGLRTMRVIKR